MIRVTYEPREHRLRVEGHALAAPAGEDLVCAAASALAWTLVRAAMKRSEYRPRLFIDRERAVVDVQCFPEESAESDCRYLFEIIAGGLAAAAENNPENIRMGGNDGN